MRWLRILSLTLGVLFVAGAAILHFWIVPANTQLPSDKTVQRSYAGTAPIIFNPTALAQGQLATALLRDVPINIQRTVTVLDTNDGSAIVRDASTMKTSTGATVGQSTETYAVDRKTLQSVPNFSSIPVSSHEGLTISFPFNTGTQDYTGWVSETQSTVPLKYTGEVQHAGLTTYVFKGTLPSTPITNPATLATLPSSLPKSLLAAAAPALGLPATTLATLQAALPSLPDPVPLAYFDARQSTYWVEPTTGAVIDLNRTDTRSAAIALPGQAPIPLAPVLQVTYAQTPVSVASAAKDAQDAANTISLLGSWLPLGLGIAGVVLLAAVPFIKPRAPQAPAEPQPRPTVPA